MLHIFTLYYGNKFTKDNVNNLYKQIKKYYKGEFTFYCYTDKKEKFANGIRRIHLIREKNPNVREAWYKIDFFMKSLEIIYLIYLHINLLPVLTLNHD